MENNEKLTCSSKGMKSGMVAVGLVACMFLCNSAIADGGNEIFGDSKEFVVTNMKGTLGSLISLSLVLCGCFIAVKTQSFWAFVMGIVMAIGLYNSPTIVDNIMDDAGVAVNTIQVQNTVSDYETTAGKEIYIH
ncbi:MAG: TraA family conjugative transfer protein [Succinivibrio sp.]